MPFLGALSLHQCGFQPTRPGCIPYLPVVFILTSSLCFPRKSGTMESSSHSLCDFQVWFLMTQVVVVLSSKNALEVLV